MMMDDSAFNVEDLKLRPEQLKNLRPVETGAAKLKRQKREFVQITREQSDRLDKVGHTAEVVFRHLMFLNWKSPGRTIYLANGALSQKGVSRYAKRRALDELKKARLIKLRKRPSKSPGIIIR
jgi:hypothetical protein